MNIIQNETFQKWYHAYVAQLPDKDEQLENAQDDDIQKEQMLKKHEIILDKLTDDGMPSCIRSQLDDYMYFLITGNHI